MSFFDKNFYKATGKKKDFVKGVNTKAKVEKVDVNRSNSEKFKKIMDNASQKYDSYFDSNNFLIKIILIILFMIVVVGVFYYVTKWYGIN